MNQPSRSLGGFRRLLGGVVARGGIGIANVTLTGKLAVDGGKHLIYSTTIASGADVTFKTGRFYYITVNGKASFVGGTYQAK